MWNRLSRQVRIFILGALGAGVAAAIITIIILAVTTRPVQPSQAPTDNLSATLSALDVSNFQVPRRYTQAWQAKWYASRPQQKRWPWEEVQRFWKDPRKSALASIAAENDKKMNTLFNGVQ